MLQMCFSYGRGHQLNIDSLSVNLCYYDMKLGQIYRLDGGPARPKPSCMISEDPR